MSVAAGGSDTKAVEIVVAARWLGLDLVDTAGPLFEELESAIDIAGVLRFKDGADAAVRRVPDFPAQVIFPGQTHYIGAKSDSLDASNDADTNGWHTVILAGSTGLWSSAF